MGNPKLMGLRPQDLPLRLQDAKLIENLDNNFGIIKWLSDKLDAKIDLKF